MAILETIMAANAAYAVIKECISNGKESANLMASVGKFLSAEEEIKEAVQKRKNSPLTAITGGDEGMWEEFQHLETIREQRRELESYIRLYGKAGQWDRWIAWQAEARKQRAAARRAAEKAREERLELFTTIMAILLAALCLLTGVYYIGVYMEKW